jgi:hypothetical protein
MVIDSLKKFCYNQHRNRNNSGTVTRLLMQWLPARAFDRAAAWFWLLVFSGSAKCFESGASPREPSFAVAKSPAKTWDFRRQSKRSSLAL